jgi:hypothetical protein
VCLVDGAPAQFVAATRLGSCKLRYGWLLHDTLATVSWKLLRHSLLLCTHSFLLPFVAV